MSDILLIVMLMNKSITGTIKERKMI